MKIILPILLLFCCISNIFSQYEKPDLNVKGVIKEIEMQEAYSNTGSAILMTKFKIAYSLKNQGSKPVIFMQNHPYINQSQVVAEKFNNEPFLVWTFGISDKLATFPTRWEKMTAEMDRPSPPAHLTRIVKPGETIEFEEFTTLDIPKFTPYSMASFLDYIQKRSPAQLKTTLDTWTTVTFFINSQSRESIQTNFAKSLRKKWIDFGYLWIDDIEVEPISIDCDSVIFKILID